VLKPNDLRKKRVAAGMKPADLASALGVTTRTLDRWETGETPITTIHEMAIRSVLSRAGTRQEATK
jgi:DNA-binding transcriptional regulator YiaG